jgi:hypothetical protein
MKLLYNHTKQLVQLSFFLFSRYTHFNRCTSHKILSPTSPWIFLVLVLCVCNFMLFLATFFIQSVYIRSLHRYMYVLISELITMILQPMKTGHLAHESLLIHFESFYRFL